MSGALSTGGPAIVVRVSANTQQAQQAFQSLQVQINGLQSHFAMLENSMRSVDHTLRYILAFAIGSVGKETIGLIQEMERLNTLMIVTEGTFENVAKKIDTLISISAKVPFSLAAITKAFQQMSASGMKDLMDDKGNGRLKTMLDTVAAFGGTEANLKLVVLALTQIQGKGTVAFEELRRQLAEQIPSAVNDMAVGLNMSMTEMLRKITKGVITAEMGLGALFDVWDRRFKGAGELLSMTFGGAIKNVKSEIDALANALAQGGALDPFTVALRKLVSVLDELKKSFTADAVQDSIKKFFDSIGANADMLGRAIAAIQSIGTAIGTLIGGIISVISQLPAESVAVGLIGFLLFGVKGAIVGALIGPAHEIFSAVISGITSIGVSIATVSGALGADISQIAAYGAIGWLLFGRAGLIAGALIGFVNDLFAQVDARVKQFASGLAGIGAYIGQVFKAGLLMPGASESASTAFSQAYADAQAHFKKVADFTKPDTTDPIAFNRVGTSADSAAQAIRRMATASQEAVATLRKDRMEFENRFKAELAVPSVLDKEGQEAIARAQKALQQMQEGLLRNTGKPGDALFLHMNVQAKALEDQINKLSAMADNFDKKFDERTSQAARAELTHVQLAYKEFIDTMAKARAAADAKVGGGSPILEKYASQIESLTAKFNTLHEQFAGGKLGNVDLQVAKMTEQMQKYRAEIEKMIITVQHARKVEGDRSGTIDALNRLLQRTNELQAEGEVIMRRKAAREVEDMTKTSGRAVEDYASQLKAAQMALQPFTSAQIEADSAMVSARSAYRGITDELDKLTRQLQDLGTDPKNQGLRDSLQLDIDKLKELQGQFKTLFEMTKNGQWQLAKLSKTFWDSVGDSIERGLGDTLGAIINRTGKVKDALVAMYSDITKAAINYLIKFALVESGLSTNGSLSGMFGGGTGGGGIFGSLFGGIGKLLGLGGGSSAAATAMPWDGGASMLSWGQGIGFANGAAFNQGIKYFAQGDILTGPRAFPLGVAGEAGPEAIMPLERGRGGRLGVRATGGGEQTNYTINIHALDSKSVRDLFLKEGNALVASLQTRDRVNRGFRQNW